jgi:hypothetical protein
MTDSIILLAIGGLYLAIGLGIVLNQSAYKKILEHVLGNRALMFITAIIAFITGAFMIAYHNVWTGSIETILVTFVGWVMTIKSALILVFPGFGAWATHVIKLHKYIVWIGALLVAIGGALIILAV